MPPSLILRFVVFFAALAGALGLANWYVARRAAGFLKLGRRTRGALFGVLVAALGAAVAGRMWARAGGGSGATVVSQVGMTVQLAVLITVALLLAVDVWPWARRRVQEVRRRFGPRRRAQGSHTVTTGLGVAPSDLVDGELAPVTSRRAFVGQLASGAALVAGPSSALYGSVFGRHDYQIEEVPLAIKGLSPRLDGFTIVQLSDIHFGTFVGLAELESAVALVKKAQPDLIVMTGDLVDNDARFAPMLGRLCERLAPLAPHGVMAVPGNHDYYAGVDQVIGAMERAGVHVLKNRGRVVGDAGGAFAMVGVDDLWTRRNGFRGGPDLDRAIAMVPPDLPRILLCHNPAFFPEASDRVALQLSGHTHGGQVNLLLRPAELFLPYVEGKYSRGEGQLYVNRGFGTAGPPARLGAPPEVTKLVLVSA